MGKGPSEGKSPHAADRGPRAINKTVHAQSKWLIVEQNSAREELVSRSQPRVRVNKISPSASGLGTNVKQERPAETKLSARDWQRFVCIACEEKGPHLKREWPKEYMVLENENGQRARRGLHIAWK